MSARSLNLLVFREGKRALKGIALKSELAESLRLLGDSYAKDKIVSALLRAGELECAVADAGTPAGELERITDATAEALVHSTPVREIRNLSGILETVDVPKSLYASVPEGFAYYALHPLAFAEVMDKLVELPARIAVIGIRNIGTTLSAVAAAALRRRRVAAERITVRPTGHPYNRRMEFFPSARDFIQRQLSLGASFLIVDEGPGLSGSSFLSVAEALVNAGVTPSKITLICSHAPEVEKLHADDAAKRWRQFRSIAVCAEARRPTEARVWIGGGEWRRLLLPQTAAWPASWLNFERLKYLSGDGSTPRFYKFLGLGHYGTEAREREEKIALGGFGPAPQIEEEGFCSYSFIDGRLMLAADLSESVLARLAAYCGFRAREFTAAAVQLDPLQEMAKHNLEELQFDIPVHLRVERPVVTDSRMQPYEWLLTRKGQMVKTDSGSHGDDHFFPGAADIAWDLASAIVEWQMSPPAMSSFLEMYRRASGDDAEKRIAAYITAYSVFRCAYCLMAANAMQGSEEQARMEKAAGMCGMELMRESASAIGSSSRGAPGSSEKSDK